MKLASTTIVLLAQSASGFTTQHVKPERFSTTLNEVDEMASVEIEMEQQVIEEPENPFLYKVTAANGWIPDEAKPCYGLPGVVSPTGYFDPIGTD